MLSGFFYTTFNKECWPSLVYRFTNVSGKGSGPCDSDGNAPFHYAVCNPVTKKWVMLPKANWASDSSYLEDHPIACLGFDPAISSHFHVLEYLEGPDGCITAVGIYSSKTGLWNLHESGWNHGVGVSYGGPRGVFLNGFMHFVAVRNEIVAVDMEGKRWKIIPMPDSGGHGAPMIDRTQGHLCALNVDPLDIFNLSLWVLEDYNTDNWILKRTVSTLELFGGKKYEFDRGYQVIAVHPECNLIFFHYGLDNTLLAYEMDPKELRVVRNLGHHTCQPVLPYVPLFSVPLAHGH
uniref:F-box associated beta-propeller type 3 domain-containing protein n=1 Tax=Oryza sativa subsp. japonica TaxID=39947 RepID=Q8SB94_ORYSJ|nr:hypothetical protein [Oryza sativa Japonica Group]